MTRDMFIDYEKNKGFWIEERFTEVLSYYVCLIFEKRGLEDKPEWYLEVYDDFLTITHGYNSGIQGFLFEDYVNFKEKREREIISILQDTKVLLQSKGKEISPEELDTTESRKIHSDFVNEWPIPIQTKSLITVLNFMIQLFEHKWEKNREVWFEGYPHPDNADVI